MTLIPADRLATTFRDTINSTYRRPWYSLWLALFSLIFVWFAWPLTIGLLGGSIVVAFFDQKSKKREGQLLFPDQASERRYFSYCKLFAKLKGAQKIWRVEAIVPTEAKMNAGYSTKIERSQGTIEQSIPQNFKLKNKLWMLSWPNYKLYLLPTHFLIFQDSVYRFESILNSSVSLTTYAMPDKGPLPSDADSLQSRHQYLNRDGSPDQRRVNNPEVHIMQYAWVKFTFPDLSELNLLVSNIDIAQQFVEGLQTLIVKASPERERLVAVERLIQHQFSSALGKQLRDAIELGTPMPTSEVAALFNIPPAQVTGAGSVFERDGFRFVRTNQRQGRQYAWRVETL